MTYTYVSLFSCAGIGCYGFKRAGWECLATSELSAKYLDIQKANNKCRVESAYICGDISNELTKLKILESIQQGLDFFGKDSVDVVMATPPCQGMSYVNQKKNANDSIRNGLVIHALDMIHRISPKIFIMENVRAFLKTLCTYKGASKTIQDAIFEHLSDVYEIKTNVVNLKEFGCESSRTRTIVIGLKREFSADIDKLFPKQKTARTLWQVIGHLPSLKTMGEIWKENVWHSFRPYKVYMRRWIEHLKPGQSAFDQKDVTRIPHKRINNEIVYNKNSMQSKYSRTVPDQVAPCITTRNDIFSAQSTIHPFDDRVFSVAELMCLMTIPKEFRWCLLSDAEIRALSKAEFKRLENVVRTVIGESVPTEFIYQFAMNVEAELKC